MTEQQNTKKGPPFAILPNKQIFPLIGLGTYKITDQEILTKLLRKALQVGYRHIDTARYYNNQIPLGAAIKTMIQQDRCKREDLFIATKNFNHKLFDPVLELKEILKLMQLKYVDIYYLHWPLTDMDQTGQEWMHRSLFQFWKSMQECVRKGYTKHLGLSNCNGQMIMQLLSFAQIKPIALQIQCHPYLQQQSLVDLARKNNMFVIAHTPLARGNSIMQSQNNVLKDETILELSGKYGKTPAQIVLKTSLARGVGVIPKTSNLQRLRQNFESWSVNLNEQDLKKIRNIEKIVRVSDGSNAIFKKIWCFD